MEVSASIPEPLCVFDDKAPGLQAALARLKAAQARYVKDLRRGGILPNSVEAMRIELTYNSNAIEGNSLTLRETQLVLEGRTPAGGKPLREVYEARNHDNALRLVEAWVTAKGARLHLKDLLAVNVRVMEGINRDPVYLFRSDRVLVEELLPAMLRLARNPEAHPAVRAAELHYNLVAVHPFNDGNGSTARLLMNYLLLRHEYPHTVVEVERRAEYMAALTEANEGRWEPFALFIIGCIERSIDRLIGSE
jgi:Fic family protein